jgi:hypothetical protein
MKELDAQKEVRVWQRVKNDPRAVSAPRVCENLQTLIMEQMQVAAAYLQLSHRTVGVEATTLMRLARQSRAQTACLKGLNILIMEKGTEAQIIPVQKGTVEALLRWCYGQELRLMKSYENHRMDPEYGPVFERMAQRSREHCCLVLELMGMIGKR